LIDGIILHLCFSVPNDKETFQEDQLTLSDGFDEDLFLEELLAFPQGVRRVPPPVEQRKTRSTKKPRKNTVTKVENLWTFDEKVRHNDDPVLALFCFDWCSHCRNFRSQFRKMAQHPSLKNVTFVDVDLKMNHLPTSFDVFESPTLRYKPASYGFNSQRKFNDYDLAGYRTVEGQLNLQNILHEVQNAKFSTTPSKKEEDFYDLEETHSENKGAFARTSNRTVLRNLVMGIRTSPKIHRITAKSINNVLSTDVFTNIIEGLVGTSKSSTATTEFLNNILTSLQKLKHHNSEEQWKENPLSKNVWKNEVYTRPNRRQQGAFKAICSSLTKALEDTSVELQQMKGKKKGQLFSSFKNNLDKHFKLLQGEIHKKESGKSLFEPVQKMLQFVGLLKLNKRDFTYSCTK